MLLVNVALFTLLLLYGPELRYGGIHLEISHISLTGASLRALSISLWEQQNAYS